MAMVYQAYAGAVVRVELPTVAAFGGYVTPQMRAQLALYIARLLTEIGEAETIEAKADGVVVVHVHAHEHESLTEVRERIGLIAHACLGEMGLGGTAAARDPAAVEEVERLRAELERLEARH